MTFSYIFADEFAGYVVWTVRVFGGEDARRVCSENGRVGGGDSVVGESGLVVVDCFVGLECCEIATEFLWL